MNPSSDTGLELYLQEPHGSQRATPLALSLTIHVLVAAGLLSLHFSAAEPVAAPWRSQAVLVAPVLPKQTPRPTLPKQVSQPKPAPVPETVTVPIRVEARAFRAPTVQPVAEPVTRPV